MKGDCGVEGLGLEKEGETKGLGEGLGPYGDGLGTSAAHGGGRGSGGRPSVSGKGSMSVG